MIENFESVCPTYARAHHTYKEQEYICEQILSNLRASGKPMTMASLSAIIKGRGCDNANPWYYPNQKVVAMAKKLMQLGLVKREEVATENEGAYIVLFSLV